MPNNKSAERRMRNSARKQVHNRSINTRLHSMETEISGSFKAGKKDDAAAAFKLVISAWDKAAKTGTVPTVAREPQEIAPGAAAWRG